MATSPTNQVRAAALAEAIATEMARAAQHVGEQG
jgi:hypothetical protein